MVESALRQCHNTSRMSVEYDYSLALDIVNRYYQNLVEDMAREICEREESIMDGGFGWMEIEDRYANKFFNISQIYCNLKKFCTAEGEDEEEPETSLSSPAATGIEASRLQIDERICNAYDVRESIGIVGREIGAKDSAITDALDRFDSERRRIKAAC